MAAASSPSGYVPARIVGVAQQTRRIVGLRVQAPPDYQWAPGQHLALSATAGDTALGYYSIASAPLESEPGLLELSAARESLPEGVQAEVESSVWISPPAGELTVERLDRAETMVLVGIGTGVAPLRAMVQAIASQGEVGRVTLLQGARFESELLFREEFLAHANEGLEYRPVLSRPETSWGARTGWVQQHLDDLNTHATFRLCGSAAMIEQVTERLLGAGVQADQIDAEGY